MTGLAAREHHRFEAAGKPYLYLVPSAAIVGLDPAADMVMQILTIGRQTPGRSWSTSPPTSSPRKRSTRRSRNC